MSRGYTFLEVLTAVSIFVVVAGTGLPLVHASIDRSQTLGATTYVAGRMALARFEAVKRSAFVAIQFIEKSDGYWFRTYVDGNSNGVLSRDIARGIDRPLSIEQRLDHQFSGVTFGIYPEVTNPDTGESFNVNDPIQIGSSGLLSFNPNGSTTAGTVFIRGRQRNQFAVRVLGATGRVRILAFHFASGRWQSR
jgi:type II secretory pathway pseudopilin PulG